MHKAKIILGVTGGFGSGKSTVAQCFKKLGARVLDADKLAHEALRPRSPVYKRLAALVGPEGLGRDGQVDRTKVASMIFKDDHLRRALEVVVHPYVFDRIQEEVKRVANGVVALDIPLLFETGFHRYCDWTVAVDASESVILKRLRRKGFFEEDIARRQAVQMPLKQKKKMADFVISNRGTLNQTRSQVLKIWQHIHRVSKGEK